MARNFIPVDREQSYLVPPSLRDWLPEPHLAWFILDAVAQMDLSPFEAKYRADGWGAAAFPPSMMVPLLLYAYCMGVRSSPPSMPTKKVRTNVRRRIETLCETDVAFRVVAGNKKPDHATIARFRRNNLKELDGLFVEILRLCAEAGLVKVGAVAIDGTKIAANAALAANRTHEGLGKEIEREVAKMLAEAESVDADEDRRYGSKRGDELPEELRTRKSRIERLRECPEGSLLRRSGPAGKARLEREAAGRAAEQERKIAERAAKELKTGEKLKGRKPKEPDPTPPPEAKANVTDPESRIMKTAKGYVQGLNAQAAVTADQIVVAAEVTQEANDTRQMVPMVEKTAENLSAVGIDRKVGAALADAGYWSEANVEALQERGGPEPFIATTKDCLPVGRQGNSGRPCGNARRRGGGSRKVSHAASAWSGSSRRNAGANSTRRGRGRWSPSSGR